MNARVLMLAWLTSIAAASSVMAAGPAAQLKAADQATPASRSLTALQRDVDAALRAEALSRRQGPNVPEIVRLMDLYREMAAHPRRDESDLLAELGQKVRARLSRIAAEIERKTAAAAKGARKNPRLPVDVTPKDPVLAQQLGPNGGAPGAGPGGQPAGGRFGGPQSFDYGPELVDIIQSLISPRTWDINGGPGAVVYYAPLRVLVVSAPDDVHPQVGDLLGQMRAAP